MSFLSTILGTVAPTLATALGGPLAGAAVKALTTELFPGEDIPADSLDARIEELVATDPEALAKIKQIDSDFKTKMKQLDIDLEGIHAGDRDSARTMQINTKSYIVPILATITVTAFFGVVFWVLSGKVTLESTLLGFILGQVSSKAEQVYNYFFGSSKGSKDKTAVLAMERGS